MHVPILLYRVKFPEIKKFFAKFPENWHLWYSAGKKIKRSSSRWWRFITATSAIGGLRVFPVIKIVITVVRRVRMSPASTAVWAWHYCTKHCMACKDRECICFCVCGRQNQKTPNLRALWLTMPLHRAVYEVWDLLCISVNGPQICFMLH